MTAKTPNVRYIVAKMHLSRFKRFFRQQTHLGGGRRKGLPLYLIVLHQSQNFRILLTIDTLCLIYIN